MILGPAGTLKTRPSASLGDRYAQPLGYVFLTIVVDDRFAHSPLLPLPCR